jgi:hypothetical protein
VASYRVCFFNNIPRNERLFKCCQRSIVVRSAASPEQAVEVAKEEFVRLEGVRDWRFHAAVIEVEMMDKNLVKATGRQSTANDNAHKRASATDALSDAPHRRTRGIGSHPRPVSRPSKAP